MVDEIIMSTIASKYEGAHYRNIWHRRPLPIKIGSDERLKSGDELSILKIA